MIKTLLYTGVRVSELIRIRTADVDLDSCRIRINQGKGAKDRYVPFPAAFKETLALHIDAQQRAGASHLFDLVRTALPCNRKRAGRGGVACRC